jgi:hypothetical protein
VVRPIQGILAVVAFSLSLFFWVLAAMSPSSVIGTVPVVLVAGVEAG